VQNSLVDMLRLEIGKKQVKGEREERRDGGRGRSAILLLLHTYTSKNTKPYVAPVSTLPLSLHCRKM
jgi:hypothetical protein